MNAPIRLLLLALLLGIAPTRAALPPNGDLPTTAVRVDDVPLTVEIADEEHERQRGLMHRTELADGHGMLFIYPSPRYRAFWMRDTPLPLDLAYLDDDGVIFQIAKLVPLSLEPVRSRRQARYVLEVPRGWFAAQGIGVGSRLHLEGDSR